MISVNRRSFLARLVSVPVIGAWLPAKYHVEAPVSSPVPHRLPMCVFGARDEVLAERSVSTEIVTVLPSLTVIRFTQKPWLVDFGEITETVHVTGWGVRFVDGMVKRCGNLDQVVLREQTLSLQFSDESIVRIT